MTKRTKLSPADLFLKLLYSIIMGAFLVFMGETFWPICNAPVCKAGDNIIMVIFSSWIFVVLCLI